MSMVRDLSEASDKAAVGEMNDLGWVKIKGTAYDFARKSPLSDVDVCTLGSPSVCTITSGNGSFLLVAPNDPMFLLSWTRSGYVPSLTEHPANSTSLVVTNSLVDEVTHVGFLHAVGHEFDPRTGVLMARALNGSGIPTAGARFAATPHNGASVPYYFKNNVPDRQGTETDADGRAMFAAATPGDIYVSASKANTVCEGYEAWSWLGDAGSTVTARVVSGAIMNLTFVCR